MFSICKKNDKEFQLELIDLIELLVRVGTKRDIPQALDLAEQFGEDYIALERKINTHDYTKDDEREERWLNYYEN